MSLELIRYRGHLSAGPAPVRGQKKHPRRSSGQPVL